MSREVNHIWYRTSASGSIITLLGEGVASPVVVRICKGIRVYVTPLTASRLGVNIIISY